MGNVRSIRSKFEKDLVQLEIKRGRLEREFRKARDDLYKMRHELVLLSEEIANIRALIRKIPRGEGNER